MTVGIVRLQTQATCEDNCDGDVNGVPCVDIEPPPCYDMCQDDDNGPND
jgi:hypothetical protein